MAALVSYAALLVAAVHLPVDAVWGAILAMALGLAFALATAWEWGDVRASRLQAVGWLLGAGALWGTAAWGVRHGGPWWLLVPLAMAALWVGTYAVGGWLAGELQRAGHLIPVLVVGALADLWSVRGGLSERVGREAVEHASAAADRLARGEAPPPPPWTSFLILQWPQPGGGGFVTVLGFGDLVFLALLAGASRRFGLAGRRTLIALGLGLALPVTLSVLLARPLPALPFVGVAFLAAHLGRLHLDRREWGITLGAAALLGGLAWLA